ncbi:PAS domain S-box protein, partial [Candidatus Bipolaricaulota bacterium]|nr:PAS domain S-box protein [Candidatus Bipolaricaulota bacterium]
TVPLPAAMPLPATPAFALIQTKSGILDWNRGAEELLGRKRDEVLKKPFQHLFPPDALPRLDELVAALPRAGRVVVTLSTLTKCGTAIPCDWQLSLIEASPEGTCFAALGLPQRRGPGALELLHLLLEGVHPEAALLVDDESRILDANTSAISTLGNCVGKFCRAFFLSQEEWRSALVCAQRGLRRNDRFTLKTRLRAAAGKAIPALVSGTRLGPYGCILLVIRDLSEQEELERERRHLESRLRAMGFRLMELQQDERARIATELHDELAQKLTLLRWKMAQVRGKDLTSRELEACCEEAIRMVDGLLQEVGDLVTRLRAPPLADLPFVQALERRARFLQEAFELPCFLTVEGDAPDLKGAARTAALYIVQEAFLNAVRHARASRVNLSVKGGAQSLVISVSDDGVGMTEAQLKRARRSPGIQGMMSRAAEVGGLLSIQSEKGKGTKVTLVLPLEPGEGR